MSLVWVAPVSAIPSAQSAPLGYEHPDWALLRLPPVSMVSSFSAPASFPLAAPLNSYQRPRGSCRQSTGQDPRQDVRAWVTGAALPPAPCIPPWGMYVSLLYNG